MTLPPSTIADSIPQGIDAAKIASALDRQFKSQGIITTVKFDSIIEIQLVGLSIPQPDRIINTIEQILGKLQISAQMVKISGMQTGALEPSWEREISIEPIANSATRHNAPSETAIVPNLLPESCPDNHMALAVVATFLGVWPIGIIAIIYASQVNSKYASGNTIGAKQDANLVKRLSTVSLSISGTLLSLIILAIFLPLFLGGSTFHKIKQEKAVGKYVRSIANNKIDEIGRVNATNNYAGFSVELNPAPPQDLDYKFEAQKLPDMGRSDRQHFLLNATPTKSNLKSIAVVVYTTDDSVRWMVKSDACISKTNSFYAPTVTINNGNLSCSVDATLASQLED
jgi:hypothetical protein